jgi:hypothetical protein
MRTRRLFPLAMLFPLALVTLAARFDKVWLLWIALASVCIATAVLGVKVLRRVDQREAYRRWLYGRCVGCGYILHGNVSGVCPECGKVIPTKPPPLPPPR